MQTKVSPELTSLTCSLTHFDCSSCEAGVPLGAAPAIRRDGTRPRGRRAGDLEQGAAWDRARALRQARLRARLDHMPRRDPGGRTTKGSDEATRGRPYNGRRASGFTGTTGNSSLTARAMAKLRCEFWQLNVATALPTGQSRQRGFVKDSFLPSIIDSRKNTLVNLDLAFVLY